MASNLTTSDPTVRLAVDIGGTFTDVVLETLLDRTTVKVLTTPAAPEEGVLEGVEHVLAQAGIKAGSLGVFLHGTTLATNAIIERKGAKTALITTEGFRDVLEIGYESRYNQYDVMIEKPAPLVPRSRRFTVPERVDVHGNILTKLDEGALRSLIPAIVGTGAKSIAVGFMHAYANPAHELRVGEILSEMAPDVSVSLSSEVCPEIREFERFTTTSANAYVRPLMSSYLGRLQERLTALGVTCPVLMMTSGGGLAALETARRFPIRLVESGPAGGAILATQIASELALDKVISFDMGGTTAKICMIENQTAGKAREFEVDRQARFMKGSGLPLRIPVIEMVEIGAGGGSIARVDAMNQITTGPDSAGADPGPAAYDRGGMEPTISDADIHLGRIDPGLFAGGRVKLAPGKSADAIERNVAQPLGLSSHLAAFGITEMVDETMSNAARVHAVEQGYEASDHTLVAFGGAAPLHVGRLAEKLHIDQIIVPTNAGVGSAIGFLRAPVAYEVVRSRSMHLRKLDIDAVNAIMDEMRAEALAVVEAGAPGAETEEHRIAFMRYAGQGHEIVVPVPARPLTDDDVGELQEAYDREYSKLYARILPNADVEVLTWALTITTKAETPVAIDSVEAMGEATPVGSRRIFDPALGEERDIALYWRPDLSPGQAVEGPAVIAEDETSSFVPESFNAAIAANGYIILDRKPEVSS
ncbi:MAG: hydantoinase/oxoprolinase family protein [Rhodospirillaceae bacterium]|nr:hydantoinase/oxoprolinase family protein [Rhodospirillaceae bacterium]